MPRISFAGSRPMGSSMRLTWKKMLLPADQRGMQAQYALHGPLMGLADSLDVSNSGSHAFQTFLPC